MSISDWGSDVCSSDLQTAQPADIGFAVLIHVVESDQASIEDRVLLPHPDFVFVERVFFRQAPFQDRQYRACGEQGAIGREVNARGQQNVDEASGVSDQDHAGFPERSEEHTSELQSLMRLSSAVICLKKNKKHK